MAEIYLTGVEELNDCITNFIYALGYDEIDCFLSTDFEYYHSTREIGYTLFENESTSKALIEFLRKNYSYIPKCSLFTFSLLHELGHYLTIDTFTKEEINNYYKEIKTYVIEEYDSKEEIKRKQMRYAATPIEKAASDVAIDILKCYYDIIVDFEMEIKKKILKFYEKNDVEL